jgi:hypothetical protein
MGLNMCLTKLIIDHQSYVILSRDIVCHAWYQAVDNYDPSSCESERFYGFRCVFTSIDHVVNMSHFLRLRPRLLGTNV